MSKFIIDRTKWRSGGNGEHASGRGDTQLLNQAGYMCCLGMVALQCRIPKDDILGQGEPSEIPSKESATEAIGVLFYEYGKTEWRSVKDTLLVGDAIGINDNELITRDKREQQLAARFAADGHELEFIGEYPAEAKP